MCWPGASVYFDFINPEGRDFWISLFDIKFFKGTDPRFHGWIDMNEPSVFDGPEGTIPRDLHHKISSQNSVMSRDVKSVYGLKMMEATYKGMLHRNNYAIRPFLLTRSAYFGSQKYGAKWTGDNSATYEELRISISQLLSLSISGIHFVGVDIPGFFGTPDDELYILFY